MGSRVIPMFFICMLFMFISLQPISACCGCCPPPQHCPNPPSHCPNPPSTPRPHPPSAPRPHLPHHGGRPPPSYTPPPATSPPLLPPIISPPRVSPPENPPPYPPYTGPPGPPSGGTPGPPSRGPPGGGGGGGGGGMPAPPPATQPKCPINALKLGLCVDLLGGLVHIGIGDPIENVCCPVLKGLLELEAAICLCTIIRIKLLNLNIFLPLALQLIATCGLTPPPGFVCPPLV